MCKASQKRVFFGFLTTPSKRGSLATLSEVGGFSTV